MNRTFMVVRPVIFFANTGVRLFCSCSLTSRIEGQSLTSLAPLMTPLCFFGDLARRCNLNCRRHGGGMRAVVLRPLISFFLGLAPCRRPAVPDGLNCKVHGALPPWGLHWPAGATRRQKTVSWRSRETVRVLLGYNYDTTMVQV